MTSLVMTGAALTLALLAVQWGPGAPNPDALGDAFSYVMVALAGVWCLAWPAKRGGGAGWGDWLAIVIGAVPAVAVGWFLADVSWRGLGYAAALQAALGVLALGVLALRGQSPTRQAWLALVLAGYLLAGPMLAYLQKEFLPRLSEPLGDYAFCLPAIVLSQGAPSTTALWLLVAVWLVIGVAGWAASSRLRRGGDERRHD